MDRVLKPGGLLYVCMKQGVGERYVGKDKDSRFYSFYQQSEVHKLFERLEVIDSRVSDYKESFIQVFFRKSSSL